MLGVHPDTRWEAEAPGGTAQEAVPSPATAAQSLRGEEVHRGLGL